MTNTTNNNQHSPTELTELDASEFGNHVRQGGWRLGLLVARNVEKGKGNGGDRRSDQFPNRETETGGKVNALTFAEMSGVGKNRVHAYSPEERGMSLTEAEQLALLLIDAVKIARDTQNKPVNRF